MTQNAVLNSDEPSAAGFPERPGRQLRVQRQSRGLDIGLVASQLHLKREILEALEQDRYETLADPVFVVGYLRNYARLLGIDPAPLVAAYRQALPEAGARGIREPGAAVPAGRALPGDRRWRGRLFMAALLAAAAGGLMLWLRDRGLLDPNALSERISSWQQPWSADPTTAPAPEAAAPAASGVADTQRLELPAAPPPAVTPPAPQPALETPPADVLAAAVQPVSSRLPPLTDADLIEEEEGAFPAGEAGDADPIPPAEPPAEPPQSPESPAGAPGASTPEVVLEFVGPSWIEVRDADRKIIFTGTMRSGDRRVLTGQPPFSFVIGNANSSRITVGGRPLDLGSRARGNVARFTLDPDAPE